MAIDNLNFYSNWLPAWQVSDKYTTNPWCLRSKNLDIFSSSKSVKATAWTEPTTTDSDVIKQDGNLVLKTDWKVYTRSWWTDTLLVDPSVNFPVYKVCYTWENGTYADATFWTAQDLVAKYEWDVLKSFVVFSDRATYTYSSVKYVPNKSFTNIDNLSLDTSDVWTDWYRFTQSTVASTASVAVIIENADFANNVPFHIYAEESQSDDANISLYNARVLVPEWYYYDAELDWMTPVSTIDFVDLTWTWDITTWIDLEVPSFPTYSWRRLLQLTFKFTKKSWASTYWWQNWRLYIDMNWWWAENHRMNGLASAWDYNEYWTYLPIKDRKLKEVWEYYWMKWTSFQTLYTWEYEWAEVNWAKLTRYDFNQYMWWVSDVSMDVIGMIVWNESVYMIWNQNWNWYIIPCDLSWGKWTPYIAYWCEFKWVANIDYLLYLVWKDRGISCLWAYNWQELVQVIGGNKESNVSDMIDNDEQYRFDWGIVNWRKNLILSTSDNRLFQYWQTYGGKWWAFIHELPSNAANVTLKANGKDLEVSYTITASWTTTKYITKYQDDVAVRNYNTEWMAVYPMVIWNHLLEKEESDLYVSYIIPSNLTKLEFWAGANHYHFWTFKMAPWTQAPAVWSTWEIEWIGNPRDLPHMLTNLDQVSFVEANGDYFTFRWVWELPVLTGNETWRLKRGWIKDTPTYLNFTEVHHFRKIWEITAWWFTEWEFRFTNLNNKLELPKSHTLQIMVKWIGTNQFTPELFSLDLVANQRDRW